MLRFKSKYSGMLRALKISSFEKTVLGRHSLCNFAGITPTGYVRNFHGFKFSPDSPRGRFSSTGSAKKFSSGRVNGLFPGPSVGDDYEADLDDSVLHDPPRKELPSGEDTREKSLLKMEHIEMLKDIANGDESVFKLLMELQVTLDISSCQYGVTMNMKREHWLEFLSISPSKRKSYATYLILNTIRAVKKNHMRSLTLYDLPMSDENEDVESEYFDDVRCYHLFHNSMFLKLRDGAIKRWNHAKGMAAILFSSSIVYDCSYSNYMTTYETRELARQINSVSSINYKSEKPFNLVLCNVQKDDKLVSDLKHMNPIIFSDEYPLIITDKSYLDLFPKSQLVYLTPHCTTSLKNYDYNRTYIIGGFVDKTHKKPVSLAKAKELQISMARLPIDEYLDWGLGDKCLSLVHMMQIMLDLRDSNGDWGKAFEVIPKRCLMKERLNTRYENSFEYEIHEFYNSLNS